MGIFSNNSQAHTTPSLQSKEHEEDERERGRRVQLRWPWSTSIPIKQNSTYWRFNRRERPKDILMGSNLESGDRSKSPAETTEWRRKLQKKMTVEIWRRRRRKKRRRVLRGTLPPDYLIAGKKNPYIYTRVWWNRKNCILAVKTEKQSICSRRQWTGIRVIFSGHFICTHWKH